MAEYGKKLHVVKNGVEEEITLYDDKSEASETALCLLDGATPVYAALGDSTDSEASSLRVLYNGQTYSVLKEVASGGPLGLRLAAEGGGYGTWEYVTPDMLKGFDPVLNNNSWEQISLATRRGLAPWLWSVGDTKAVTLNGNVSNGLTLNNYTCYANILGFDHNKELETGGQSSIHFILGKNTSNKDIAFCDFTGANWSRKSSGTWFNHSNNNANSGGWKSSNIRTNIMPKFIDALPSDLQSVLGTVTKYTDNTGGGSDNSSYVTSTSDKMFLLAEFEAFGASHGANNAEKNWQAQYAYYANGNSGIRYNNQTPSSAVTWWLRSVYLGSSGAFCHVYKDGTYSGSDDAIFALGVAPCFAIF